ncbi:hypothetical protein CE91St41_24610 [Oscillospiraceae bacterium]|nr:hypothetical protein CE91St40_12930 [Oscillospiraceae bacterium]BDF75572.1 hypothetical protein CE91St41_24610 [Oscillospiraceae bacterium]
MKGGPVMLNDERVEAANRQALERIQCSSVSLVGVTKAGDVLPCLTSGRAVTHSGPPTGWAEMCPAMQGAVCGAAVLEGWAQGLEQARQLAEQGEIRFYSNHDHGSAGPMAGIISPSMPVFHFVNEAYGNSVYVTMNEGLGKALRFGANDAQVLDRLRWMEQVLAPILAEALELSGPVNITEMSARGIQRGDDCHNRNKASTGLFIRHMAPWMARTGRSKADIAATLAFLDANDHFFLNLSIGNCKATMDTIRGLPHSSIVSCMCSNGYQFGIQTAGTGAVWFTAASPRARGNYFAGYSDRDACPVMGDSYITETAGLGAFAMAAALGIGRFIGVDTHQAQQFSSDMYPITAAEHRRYKIPVFDYRGTPVGIDIRRVLETGTLPVINTGIAHADPGIGQIGAGIVSPPIECFRQAYHQLKKGA